MREILFRGKRVDNGEWVYGDLIHHDGYVAIWDKNASYVEDFEVIPETVGQYTGLISNGKKIFEGDVLEFKTAIKTYCGCVALSEAGCWCMKIFSQCYSLHQAIKIRHAKIIGNIHNNPILLKDNKND